MENTTGMCICVQRDASLLTITLNRPEKKNALTHDMYSAMVEALEEAQADAAVRAICLRGTDSCFTSGNDLKDFLACPPTNEESPVMRFMHALIDVKKPLVAAVQGPAVGIGVTMTLHCDLVYASPTAVFKTPFTQLALCPEAASSYLLPRIIGIPRAMSMLMLGQSIDAETAAQWGLVTELFPQEEFDARLRERMDALTALPPEAVRATKALMRDPYREHSHEAVQREAALFLQRLMSAEAAEAMQAFLERRPPDFSRFA